MKSIPIFIGYDHREAVVYHVCVNSIIRHSSATLSVTPLALNNLSNYVETHTDGSNHFIYSRFLVPHLMNYQGWAIFMDGDMLLRDDIAKLWQMRDDKHAAMVVKHNYKTKMSTKYLGAKNEDYPCKNWSSVILWNCGHPKNRVLTPEFIQQATGAQLHRFTWLTPETDVGSLPVEWNWLPDEFGTNLEAKLIHHTLGSPCFHDFATTPMADEWHRERIYTDFCLQRGLN